MTINKAIQQSFRIDFGCWFHSGPEKRCEQGDDSCPACDGRMLESVVLSVDQNEKSEENG
jgi:hypothetical protein